MAKILVDVERRRHPMTGLAYYCECLEQGLRELAPEEGIRFYGKRRGRDSDYLPWRSWHSWLCNQHPSAYDVVHITHQQQRYFKRASLRPKYVLTLHDLNYLHEPLSPRTRDYYERMARLNLERADVIVCISDYVRQDLELHRAEFSLKPNAEIRVIHNGLRFEGIQPEVPEGFTLGEKTPFLLSIGVLQSKKQQHLLVEMLAQLPKEYHLVLVYSSATESYQAKLTELISAHQLAGRVHFLRSVSAAEKQYLLEQCTAYLHPSIAEGFGIPPIEAMHCAKPVFLSTATSLPEIGGEEAYYFDDLEPDKMAQVLLEGLTDFRQDSAKPTRLRAWAERYDYRRMASEYLNLYQALARQSL